MTDIEFKAGDKVYCPYFSTKIFTLEAQKDNDEYLTNSFDIFTKIGTRCIGDPFQSIFHATPENQALLSKLYGMEFEKLMCSIYGYEYPAPHNEVLKYGTKYYIPNFKYGDNVADYYWKDTDEDFYYLKKGLIHLTPENAKAHDEAIFRAVTESLRD